MIRLNKLLASSLGISRRKADVIISKGEIEVNSEVANIGATVDITKDIVKFKGKIIKESQKKYYAFAKPKGYICSRMRQGETKTIYSLINDNSLKYAGRLDKDSEGLLLLSNDGDWINEMTHPKYKIKKVYIVGTNKIINRNEFKLKIKVETSKYEILKLVKIEDYLYKVTLGTGKNREIREIFKYNNIGITSLKRIRMGKYTLGDMKPGELVQIEMMSNEK